MSELNEKTKVAMPIASWWHLLIIVGTILFAYFGMKGDISAALGQSQRNQTEIVEMRQKIDALRMDQAEIKSGLGYFRQQYEQDKKREGYR